MVLGYNAVNSIINSYILEWLTALINFKLLLIIESKFNAFKMHLKYVYNELYESLSD